MKISRRKLRHLIEQVVLENELLNEDKKPGSKAGPDKQGRIYSTQAMYSGTLGSVIGGVDLIQKSTNLALKVMTYPKQCFYSQNGNH